MKRFTSREKQTMRKLYAHGTSVQTIAEVYQCAYSTAYYITHPDAYDRHVAYVAYMRMIKYK